ncbi:MAG: SCO1664 family protein [Anaerolineae bacterium]|nr:MAG: SCO1664 family protein [Anaerolineae bacterium]
MDEHILQALRQGVLTLKGEFVHGLNYSFLAEVESAGRTFLAVYKPTEGEQPLWDFPEGTLAHREVAAYLVSEALGWHLVPPTVYRPQAPFGPGSLQQFIPHDPNRHYFTLTADERQRLLKPVALFDHVVNNADRKGSHLLFDENDRLWLIDHGICFHVEDKLRTVIWDFVDQPVPRRLRADLERLLALLESPSELVAALEQHLAPEEIAALARRTADFARRPTFPPPPSDRRAYPYPPL